MLFNVLKLAFKNLYRDKLYSVLNLVGLAVGFSCFLTLFLYLRSEVTYDQHFVDHERIYRLTFNMQIAGSQSQHARTGSMVAPLLSQNYAQFEDFVRLNPVGGVGMTLIRDDITATWDGDTFYSADNSVFDIFNNTVIAGNPETALTQPRTVAINESLAKFYFGEEDPIGQTLGIQIAANQFTVDLVFEDLPENTSHRYDMLFSEVNSQGLTADSENFFPIGIFAFNSYTFFRLPANYDSEDFSEISNDFFSQYVSAGAQQVFPDQSPQLNFQLQPLDDIYLSSPLQDDVPKGNPIMIVALSAVTIFILGIASINYMNLSTARFATRAKEVGVRRTLGASNAQLFYQFLTEGILFSMLALLIAISLTELLFSTAIDSTLLGKDLSVFLGDNISLLLQLFLIASSVGFISGCYPAFYFSSVKPIDVFRPIVRISGLGISLRSILIGLQMLVSISVIAGALVMAQQLNFMKSRPLGFDKENKLIVNATVIGSGSDYRTLMTELSNHPDIDNASMADLLPGASTYEQSVIMQNDFGEQVNMLIDSYVVDENYLQTFSMSLTAGRNFTAGNRASTDVNVYPYLVNETLVNQMGWDDPIGKEIVSPAGDITGEVIGVIADFNFSSLHEEIKPLVLDFFYDDYRWGRHLIMDINSEKLQEILPYVENLMLTAAPETSFEYSFLDETLETLYSSEQNQTQLTLIGSGVCIVIAFLGLFGLTSFTIDQKTKEIGIRRVLGASVTRIMAVMFKWIFALIIVSAIVASVLVFYSLTIWLESFAYRISISPIIFIIAALSVLLVSAAIVAFQSIQVTQNKPVEALRYE